MVMLVKCGEGSLTRHLWDGFVDGFHAIAHLNQCTIGELCRSSGPELPPLKNGGKFMALVGVRFNSCGVVSGVSCRI